MPGLATVLAPLYRLLEKGVPWRWTKECREALRQARELLAGPQVLVRYDAELPLKLVTDASVTGIGAALKQRVSGEGVATDHVCV